MKTKQMWIDFTKYLYPGGLLVPRKMISLIKNVKKERQTKYPFTFTYDGYRR